MTIVTSATANPYLRKRRSISEDCLWGEFCQTSSLSQSRG